MTQQLLATEGPLNLEDFRYWAASLDAEWNMSLEEEDSFEDQIFGEEALYFQKFGIEAPYGKSTVKTGSAPADADAAIDSLTPTDIQVRVRPARNREAHRKRAQHLAKFGRGLLAQLTRYKDLFRLCASDVVIRRVGIFRIMYDERLWPAMPPEAKTAAQKDEFEWKRRNKFPILAEVRSPHIVRWRATDEGDPIVVVEKYRTTIGEARISLSMYPKALGYMVSRRPNDSIGISDVWIGLYRCVLLEDMPILPEANGIELHGYRRPPFVLIPFRELHFEEPGRRYRGMLSNAAGLYVTESQVLTMHVWQLKWNSWRTWQGHFADPKREVRIAPGEFIDVDKQRGEWIEMLAGEPVPPELLQTASMIGIYIQRNGISQGPSTQEGARSAQQVWASQSLRQMKVEPGKQAMQRGIERILTTCAEILIDRLPDEKITLPVPGKDEAGDPIGTITISAADLDGYTESFTVTFGRRLDPALLEQAKTVMGLAQNMWMPREVSWEMAGLTDAPEEWANMLYIQQVNDLDFMKEVAGYEQISERFGAKSWQANYFKQRMQTPPPGKGGQPEQSGIVGQPPSPIQPTALPAGPSPTRGPSPVAGRSAPAAPANVPSGGMPGNSNGGM